MSVRPVLVEVGLCFGRVREWNLPDVPAIYSQQSCYLTVRNNDNNIHVPYTKHNNSFTFRKYTSLFDLSQNNNISKYDIHTIPNDLSQTTV